MWFWYRCAQGGKNSYIDLPSPEPPYHLICQIVNGIRWSNKIGRGWSRIPIFPLKDNYSRKNQSSKFKVKCQNYPLSLCIDFEILNFPQQQPSITMEPVSWHCNLHREVKGPYRELIRSIYNAYTKHIPSIYQPYTKHIQRRYIHQSNFIDLL